MTKCHLEVFLNELINHFPFFLYFFFIVVWFSVVIHQLLKWMQSECKTLSGDSFTLRKHLPWSHGLADIMTGSDSLCRLSNGYCYINLPPIFTCRLSVVLMYLVKKKKQRKKKKLLYTLLFSFTKNTWPQRASPAADCGGSALSTCCCWRENCCLCDSIPKWLTAHLCVCTLL